MAMQKSMFKFARQLNKQIGAHYRLIGTGCTDEDYHRARAESDQAESLARYMMQYLPQLQADVIRAVVGVKL